MTAKPIPLFECDACPDMPVVEWKKKGLTAIQANKHAPGEGDRQQYHDVCRLAVCPNCGTVYQVAMDDFIAFRKDGSRKNVKRGDYARVPENALAVLRDLAQPNEAIRTGDFGPTANPELRAEVEVMMADIAARHEAAREPGHDC
jgi:hypothetical protein